MKFDKESIQKDFKNTVLKTAGDHKQLMRLTKILGTKYTIVTACVISSLFIFLCSNFFINFFIGLLNADIKPRASYFFIIHIGYVFRNKFFLLLYVFVFGFIAVNDLRIAYLFKTNWEEQNVDQKGSSRFTTKEEIKKQFKEIDDTTTRFPGYGGVPVCRMDNKLYIDDSPTNTCHVGITRSGKGETFVIPEIDIYSRGEQQPSLLVLDMKSELIKSSYYKLVERGYNVEYFSLEEPEIGFQYNPLSLILKAYKEGDISHAELLCQSFGYSLFSSSESAGGDDNAKFFLETASSAVSALILAYITDCLDEDKRINARLSFQWLTAQKEFLMLSPERQQKSRLEFKELQKRDDVTTQDYLLLEEIPDDIPFIPARDNEKKVNMFSIHQTFSALASIHIDEMTTQLDIYFQSRPAMDRAKGIYAAIKVAGDRTKGSIFAQALTKLDLYAYDNIAKLTSKSTFDLEELGFGKKPVALFIGVPFYDRSKDTLVSTMIGQVFSANSRRASKTKELKCQRRIIYHLDEIGQYPAIKDFKTMLSVGLGIGMVFNLFIQSYNQLDSTYGKDAATIKDNCGNHIYIQTISKDTAEYFSSLLGNETITNITRTGRKLSLDKTITELYEEKPLLNPNELMELREGENVIKRVMKRTDLTGKPVKPRPIFNNLDLGTAYKYRYQYLIQDFPNPDEIALSELPLTQSDFSSFELDDIVYDYNISFSKYEYNHLKQKVYAGEALEPEEEGLLDHYREMFRYDELIKRNKNYKEIEDFLTGHQIPFVLKKRTTIADLMDFVSQENLPVEDKDHLYWILLHPEKVKSQTVPDYLDYSSFYS